MFELFNLPKTVTKKTQRVGRGEGSNRGKNSGKGHKGQNKHGQGTRFGFEGGQKTLIRRTPKFRGFKAREVKDLVVLSLGVLDKFFESGETVSLLSLQSKGLANQFVKRVRIINSGSLTKKLVFEDSDNIYLTKGAKLLVNSK